MKIKDIKKENRPIERMLINGPGSLSNEELLAILINTGTKTKSSLDISYEIINSLNKFDDLLEYSINELMSFEGIKETKAARIEAAIELTRRLLISKQIKTKVITHTDAANIIYPILFGHKEESILVLFLDSKTNLICMKQYVGTLSQITIPVNDILKWAIKNSARGIIIAHNHPSGDPIPSESDIKSTIFINNKLLEFDLYLFDHIIIGENRYYSFEEQDSFSINY